MGWLCSCRWSTAGRSAPIWLSWTHCMRDVATGASAPCVATTYFRPASPPSPFAIAERVWIRKGKGVGELHSEQESYRSVLERRTPEGGVATVIVMRRRNLVWITFNGAIKPTFV